MKAQVVRPLSEEETGMFIPSRELLEPDASEVTLAVAKFIAERIKLGAHDERGELLVKTRSKMLTSTSYSIFIARSTEQ